MTNLRLLKSLILSALISNWLCSIIKTAVIFSRLCSTSSKNQDLYAKSFIVLTKVSELIFFAKQMQGAVNISTVWQSLCSNSADICFAGKHGKSFAQ